LIARVNGGDLLFGDFNWDASTPDWAVRAYAGLMRKANPKATSRFAS
jgi:hypothetical protein